MFAPTRIKKVTPCGVKKVFDVSVSTDHSYVGNGIVCHNSSSGPNLQNQSNDGEFPIRSSFVAPSGSVFICGDYSQVELRVLAHFCKDPAMTEGFLAGADFHAWAATLVGCTRKRAKILNFGVIFGMGIKKFAANFGTTVDEAKRIIAAYFAAFPYIKQYQNSIENYAQNNGFVRTIAGRIRLLRHAAYPTRRSSETDKEYKDRVGLHKADMRKALNTKVQGSAADIMKKAMVLMYRRFERDNLDAHILLTVHDELLVEVPNAHDSKNVLKVYDAFVEEMQNAWQLNVPLKAEAKIIRSWGDMKDEEAPGLLPYYLSLPKSGQRSQTSVVTHPIFRTYAAHQN